MSSEQARGQSVDQRTDIWAFGCVLFEPTSGLWRITLRDGSVRQVTSGDTWYTHPDITTSGAIASRMRLQTDIWKFPMDGTPEFEIRAASPKDGQFRVLARISPTRVPIWQIVNPALSPDER